CGASTERNESWMFKATAAGIIKEQCATAAVEPENAEKKSHVTDARGDESLFCRRRGARLLNPKSDQQIRCKPDQFPANEKKKQTVRDDHAEHRAGEERKICEEPGEIFVLGHVANAEDKNAQPEQRDHHQHGSSQRIEHPSDAQRLFPESEPAEIVDGAETVRLQRQ